MSSSNKEYTKSWIASMYGHDHRFFVLNRGQAYIKFGYYTGSDERLKRNISTIQRPMNTLLSLRGVRYQLKPDTLLSPVPGWGDSLRIAPNNEWQLGFVAQEAQEFVPESAQRMVVGEDTLTDTVLALNYSSYVPLLVEGIKEQQATIVDLLNRVAMLEDQVHNYQYNIEELYSLWGNCCGSMGMLMAPQNQEGALLQTDSVPSGPGNTAGPPAQPYLGQSVPNPTTGGALIPYELPANTPAGSNIKVFALGQFPTGSPVLTFALTQNGAGSISIAASALDMGTYAYALYINNQPVAVRYLLKMQD